MSSTSRRLARIAALFVTPVESSGASNTGSTATALPCPPPAPAAGFAAASGRLPAPTIVVLCAVGRSHAVAATIAMAMARVFGTPCAIAGVVGLGAAAPGSGLATLAARRTAAGLRARGEHASAAGRLVWLADRRAAAPEGVTGADLAAEAAAMSVDLGRAAAATGVPTVLAIPFARTIALDRVLAWHDGVVAIREPGAMAAVVDRVAASVAALGLPIVCVPPPSRHAAAVARAGLWTPSFAPCAIAALGIGSPSDAPTG